MFMDSKAHFQEDNRNIVIVEEAGNMEEAEAMADEFLNGEMAADEGGARYQRIKVSGIRRGDKYYFEALISA